MTERIEHRKPFLTNLLAASAQEVRLHEVNPARSYLPAWISNSLVRSRLPSSAGGGAESELLRTPNLANTIHGSLHGGQVLACSHSWSILSPSCLVTTCMAALSPCPCVSIEQGGLATLCQHSLFACIC
jgi:hypothetical protein